MIIIIIVVHFVMKLGALKFKFSSNDGDDDGGSGVTLFGVLAETQSNRNISSVSDFHFYCRSHQIYDYGFVCLSVHTTQIRENS